MVADVCTLSPSRVARALFRRPTVTCVVCCEVLEHALNPKGICRWAHRALAANGVFILTAANPERFEHSGIDGGNLQEGEHYHGVAKRELAAWLKPFTGSEITLSGADIYATAWKGRRPRRRAS
jgi:2-polyprenyl-3-methyl-5-hydroxy-6-metoxy-1,4-benzoquinol methylase